MTNPLMEYLETPAQPQQQAQAPAAGAEKYYGPVAEGYDAKRVNDEKWIVEQKIITEMLSDLPRGSVILDCPVGTGRFLEFYMSRGFNFIGADLSGDMLVQSALKLVKQSEVERWVEACSQANQIIPFNVPGKGTLVNGDIREVGLDDKSVDVAVMCRLTRWLSPEDCQRAMRQLQRVCRQRIIVTARVANHKHARSVELFETALENDWKLVRNEAGYVLDYRVLMFQRQG